MRQVLTFVVLFLLAGAIPEFGHRKTSAAIVEIAVSGRIGVQDPITLLPDEIRTGEPWSGVIRYDTNIPDPDPDPKFGFYFDAARPEGISISVNVHGHTFYGGNGELHASVMNDVVLVPGQVFGYPPGDFFGMGGPMSQSPYLLDTSSIFFEWYDASGAALSSDDLPTSFDPFDFVEGGLSAMTGLPTFSPIWIVIDDMGSTTSYYRVIASIEHADIRVVPEPETVWLGILAFALLTCWWIACLSQRRRRLSHSSDTTF